jgi:hypothetical protein
MNSHLLPEIFVYYIKVFITVAFGVLWLLFLLNRYTHVRPIQGLFISLRSLKDDIRIRISQRLLRRRRQLAEVRYGLESYKKDIERRVRDSSKIYLLFVTAETIIFDPRERFIADALRNLPHEFLQKKDIRIKLRFSKSDSFEERSRWFREELNRNREPWAPLTIEEHQARINAVVQELYSITGKEVEYYHTEPLWRLIIFDDAMFVATYIDINQRRVQGRLASVEYVPSMSPIYNGLTNYFNIIE